MARSSFINLLLIVYLNQLIRMSSALKEEAEGRTVINLSGIQNGELKSFMTKNDYKDEIITELKSQLKNHEDRIYYLEKKVMGPSQKTDSMSNFINNQPRSSDDVVINSNKLRGKRPFRLLPSPSALFQSNKREEDDPTKRMPTSCADLNSIGHTLNAFYIVKENLANSFQLQIIYCNFQNSASSDDNNVAMEKRVGFIDIKSTANGVYFYVQRSGTKTIQGPAVLRYDVLRENSAGAMNRSTGVFTVPKPGVYQFHFTGLKHSDMNQLIIYLRVNGVNVASSYTGYGPVMYTVAIHSTFELKRGDKVDVYVEKGTFSGCGSDNCVHFTGWLLKENITYP